MLSHFTKDISSSAHEMGMYEEKLNYIAQKILRHTQTQPQDDMRMVIFETVLKRELAAEDTCHTHFVQFSETLTGHLVSIFFSPNATQCVSESPKKTRQHDFVESKVEKGEHTLLQFCLCFIKWS